VIHVQHRSLLRATPADHAPVAVFEECPVAQILPLKGCTKTAFDPLRAASPQAAKASGARESLPQLILVALHATNLGQLLKDVPFFFVRKTLLERSLFVADTLGSRRETGR
jgi:hypothetical protein